MSRRAAARFVGIHRPALPTWFRVDCCKKKNKKPNISHSFSLAVVLTLFYIYNDYKIQMNCDRRACLTTKKEVTAYAISISCDVKCDFHICFFGCLPVCEKYKQETAAAYGRIFRFGGSSFYPPVQRKIRFPFFRCFFIHQIHADVCLEQHLQ